MRVQVQLLGGFTVAVDGAPVLPAQWGGRQPAALVKVLALAPGRRLHRDRVVDTLWPELGMEVALPRLHKAAHYARRALGDREAVVLRDEVVALFPGAPVEVDALAFERAAEAALAVRPPSAADCATALALAGELLPDDLAEPWLEEPRARLRLRAAELMRGARRWDDLLRVDPADEEAHVALLRDAVARGDRTEALRRYARMEQALAAELGIAPGPDAVALRDTLLAPAAPFDRPVAVRAAPPPDRPGLEEREAELLALRAAVAAAVRDRRGVVALVSGEAGAGKSALVRAFLDELEPDVTAAVGGCDDLLAPRSLGPFRDMADHLPEVAAALSGDGLDSALPALLHVFGSRPSVVVVEDVHWADDATLDAVRYLSRRISGIPAVLVLTFRETGVDADHPLRQILGSLSGASVRRVPLPPLTAAAVRRLGGVSAAEAAEIHRVTEGNPFFVTEVLAAGSGIAVPQTVRDAVLARLGRLPPAVRTLVERLSVVPTRAERWLADVLGEGDPAVVVEAERCGIVLGGIASVSFRHELARRAIESSLLPGERLRANEAVVDALLHQSGVEPSRLVHHAERAGRIDVVLEHGPAVAAEAVRLGAHRQAAGVLGVMLDHRDRLDPSTVADLSVRRAYSLYVVNQFEAALRCAEDGVAAAEESGDPAQLADALLVLARVALFASGPLLSRTAGERAVGILEPAGDDGRLAAALVELARAHSNLLTVGVVAEPSEHEEAYAERAVAIGARLGRTDLVGQASCYLGDARLARGDQRGVEDLRRAVELAGSVGRAEQQVRGYVNAAGAAYRSGRPADAEALVAAGLRVAADMEFFSGQYRLRLTAAGVRASRGDWRRAVADLRALAHGPGEPGVMAALARSLLARLLARTGDPDAGEVLASALAQFGGSEDSFVTGPLSVARAELGWLDGSLAALTEPAEHALELAARSGHRTVRAELSAYLRRAGIELAVPGDAPGPWAPTLAGRWEEAAAGWATLGERYERAVVLATAPSRAARVEGLAVLRELGATATFTAL